MPQINHIASDGVRTTRVQPPSELEIVSIGLIPKPQCSRDGSPRVAVTCSVDAKRAPDIGDGVIRESIGLTWGAFWKRIAEHDTLFRPPDDGSQTPVEVDQSRLEVLVPY